MSAKLVKNASGRIYYGMHFYPGVAEYREPNGDFYRVFLNEDTIRKMGPSFAGKPVYVNHVDEVNDDLDELRAEADGWVIESFFNAADGKHWVKFIATSERAERAIKAGMRLSNAYQPESFTQGAQWNGVDYAKEITGAEYDHLAIVSNPRYDESVILTPEQFKQYNEDKAGQLKLLANSKEENRKMGFKLFKRAKVENAADFEAMSVILPKSGREMTITELVTEMDGMEDAKKKNEVMADPGHKVKMHDGSMCNVAELLEKHKSMNAELDALKAEKKDALESDKGLEVADESVDVEGDKANEDGDDMDGMENEEDDEEEKDKAKKKNAADKVAADELAAKKAAAKAKAEKLRNAADKAKNDIIENEFEEESESNLVTMNDRAALGKKRYGSK